MSNADQVQLSAREEVTFATAPSGEYLDVRYTGESLAHQKQTTESRQITAGRQVNDLIRTNVGVQGDVNIEFSFGSYDDFLASTLFSAGFSSSVQLLGAAAMTAVSGTGNLGGTGIGDSAVVGQWIKITGGALNDGWIGKIISITDSDNIVVAGYTALANASESVTSIDMGAQIVNGTTMRSWTFEKNYVDNTTDFEQLRGCVFGGMNLAYPSDDILTGSFSIQGKEGESLSASSGSSYAAQATTDVFTAANDVLAIIEGTPVAGQANAQQATNFGFELTNNLRQRQVIGSLGPISFGAGKMGITGTLQTFYDSIAIMDKYIDHGKSALTVLMADEAGNTYIVEFPRIRYSTGQRVAGGENTDVLADMGWTAVRHETELITVRITKF